MMWTFRTVGGYAVKNGHDRTERQQRLRRTRQEYEPGISIRVAVGGLVVLLVVIAALYIILVAH